MNAGMKDMLNVMCKFLAMGLSVDDVIRRSTWNPAREIQREELGNLSVGSPADVAVLRVENGKFGFTDMYGARLQGQAEADLRADAPRRQSRLRPERHHPPRLGQAAQRLHAKPATPAGTPSPPLVGLPRSNGLSIPPPQHCEPQQQKERGHTEPRCKR